MLFSSKNFILSGGRKRQSDSPSSALPSPAVLCPSMCHQNERTYRCLGPASSDQGAVVKAPRHLCSPKRVSFSSSYLNLSKHLVLEAEP